MLTKAQEWELFLKNCVDKVFGKQAMLHIKDKYKVVECRKWIAEDKEVTAADLMHPNPMIREVAKRILEGNYPQ